VGVFTTRNGGEDWTTATGPEAPPSAGALAVDPVHPATVYAATPFDVYKTTDRGQTWSKHALGGSGEVAVLAMAVDPTDPSVIIAGTEDRFSDGGLYRSTDGGITWLWVEGPPATITRLAIGSDSTLYIGTSGHALFSGPAT
jgi:photosystem II stability/assembly factor-like uncharacterized protein